MILLAPHQLFLAIHPDQVVREREYRELFRVNLSRQDIHAIREALSANQILGEGRFKEQVEAALERKVGYVRRGRPAKVVD